MTPHFELAPGVHYWPERLDDRAQDELLEAIRSRVTAAPFYRPTMPGSGAPLSVEMTNFGPLGWVTDQAGGYRYEERHPISGEPWPDIPPSLLALWAEITAYPTVPEACLVNLYRGTARMGLHRDADEQAADAPVLSVSLGDTAVFRFGGLSRRGTTATLKLNSGDVLMFGGPARMMYHGIDRILAGSSSFIPGGGRINLTLRRVTGSTDGQEKGDRLGGQPVAQTR
jgi:alkylated DNA repair protein (DNA oxidative demethylase)